MTDQQLSHFRQLLADYRTSVEEDIAGLEQEMTSYGDETRTDITVANHPADSADELTAREQHVALIQNLRAQLNDIERAEHRMAQGQYGICEGCGTPINEERLEALPSATRCITCQEAQERRR